MIAQVILGSLYGFLKLSLNFSAPAEAGALRLSKNFILHSNL